MNDIPSVSEFGCGRDSVKRDVVYAETGSAGEIASLIEQFAEYGPDIEIIEISERRHLILVDAERAAALSETSDGAAVLRQSFEDTVNRFKERQMEGAMQD